MIIRMNEFQVNFHTHIRAQGASLDSWCGSPGQFLEASRKDLRFSLTKRWGHHATEAGTSEGDGGTGVLPKCWGGCPWGADRQWARNSPVLWRAGVSRQSRKPPPYLYSPFSLANPWQDLKSLNNCKRTAQHPDLYLPSHRNDPDTSVCSGATALSSIERYSSRAQQSGL